MEALRIFHRQTLSQVIRTRPLQTPVQNLRARIPAALRTTHAAPKLQLRSLQTRPPSTYANIRKFARPFQRAARHYATSAAPTEQLSLSQRLKKLSREYGWSALGIYLFLSALDFPFCFLAVRLLGTDRIGHWEHVVISTVKEWIKWPFDSQTQDKIDGAVHEVKSVIQEKVPVDDLKEHGTQRVLEEDETYVVVDHGYKQASEANRGANASIWTQLALAYAIHKSFIFVRVPLTAAVTPKIVKTLRSWGWNIGKKPTKAVAAGKTPSPTAGVNTKGSGVKSD